MHSASRELHLGGLGSIWLPLALTSIVGVRRTWTPLQATAFGNRTYKVSRMGLCSQHACSMRCGAVVVDCG